MFNNPNAVNVVLRDNHNDRLALHEIEKNTADEMFGQNISKVIPHGDWAINNPGEMILYTNKRVLPGQTQEEKRDLYLSGTEYMNYQLSAEEYISVIAHEFGHFLGLGDAYLSEYEFDPDEVPKDEWPMGDAMINNGAVTSNDVEMVLEASKLNKQQDFTQDNLSLVIRLEGKDELRK